MTKLIVPEWPLPEGVAAFSSTRIGGVSQGAWASLNLGAHCGDNLEHVEENRKRLYAAGNLPSKPVWLEQVHGKAVLKLTGEPYASKRADASYSNTPGTVCAVMTADCLPVLFCNRAGTEIAAAHAGCVKACWKRPLPASRTILQISSPGLARRLARRHLKWGLRFGKLLWKKILRRLMRLWRPAINIWPIFISLPASALIMSA